MTVNVVAIRSSTCSPATPCTARILVRQVIYIRRKPYSGVIGSASPPGRKSVPRRDDLPAASARRRKQSRIRVHPLAAPARQAPGSSGRAAAPGSVTPSKDGVCAVRSPHTRHLPGRLASAPRQDQTRPGPVSSRMRVDGRPSPNIRVSGCPGDLKCAEPSSRQKFGGFGMPTHHPTNGIPRPGIARPYGFQTESRPAGNELRSQCMTLRSGTALCSKLQKSPDQRDDKTSIIRQVVVCLSGCDERN